VLNRATIRVANTGDVSGRVTADSINNGSRAERKSSLWRAFGLTIFCSVVSAGVLASLTPVPALADDDEGVRKEIAALKKQVAGLQSQVEALQDQLAAVQSNNALKLGKFVTVDPNPENGVRGPNITFKGANIHIVSGSGATDDNLSHGGTLTGLGNLIIGYDELLFPGEDRGGSHNLVIGMFHTFTSSAFGGLVAGEENIISAEAASVSGGANNTASGLLASVSGGQLNTASGIEASVSGGFGNIASGTEASVSGGAENTASALLASVSGGDSNTASGPDASVSGGVENTASGTEASVSGGAVNIASGLLASVSGGAGNTAGGIETVVIGGTGITDNKNNSIAPSPPFP
jgi:hypothetical protein